jgi:hypothetical protein
VLGALRRFLAGRIFHPWSILPVSIGNAPAPVRQRDHQLGKAVEQAAIGQRDCRECYPGARDASVRRRRSVSDASSPNRTGPLSFFVEPCALSRSRVASYMRAGFVFSGLELRVMTLSTKYQGFVRQQVKQSGSLDFNPDVILWHHTNGSGLFGILETRIIFSTQVSCVNTSAECRFWVAIALAIPMATVQVPR